MEELSWKVLTQLVQTVVEEHCTQFARVTLHSWQTPPFRA